MSTDESLAKKIRESQEAVQAHVECLMPHRRAEWIKKLKRRRPLPKPRQTPPSSDFAFPTQGTEKSLLDANPGVGPRESKRTLKRRRFEEEGIESFWFGNR